MKTGKVAKSQILAGALLKFGEVDIYDLYIIGEDINKTHQFEKRYNSNINLYLQGTNGLISLEDGLTLDSVIPPYNISLQELLKQEQGPIMEKYYANLDEEEYVLRKLNNLSDINKERVLKLFGSKHKNIINELFDNNMIITTWNEDVIHCDYPEIKLTNKGKARLFMADHKEEIYQFAECLNSFNYDQTLLKDYLETQDLDNPKKDIFTIDSFNYFCSVYDRCPTKTNSKQNVELPKIKYKKKTEA